MKSSPPPSSEPLIIVCASDEGYSQPLSVVIASTLKHLSPQRKAIFYIIDGGLSARTRQRLERVASRAKADAELRFVSTSPEKLNSLVGHRHISVAAYLRLFIPSLLPETVRQAIYLDCDVLVESDLAALWDEGTRTENGPCAVAAIRDFAIASITHPWSHVPGWQELQIDPLAPTFNTGVLLMDLSYWREHNVTQSVVDYAVRHAGKLDNCDQDALNAILAPSWKPLNESWNVQYSLLYLRDLPVPDQTSADFYQALGRDRPRLLKEAKILHFTDRIKPWQHWCRHPATFKWAVALLRSGWFSPVEAVRWALPWGAKFFASRLKLALGLSQMREKMDVDAAPFVVQPPQT